MKKNLLFITLFLFSLGLSAQQWTLQNTNMAGTNTFAYQVSVVDSNIVWINGLNGSNGQFIQANAKTQDGGATWTAGTYSGFGPSVEAAVLCGVSYNKAFCIGMDTVTGGVASFWKTTDGTNWSLVTGVMNDGTNTFADGVEFWDNGKGFCYGDPVGGEFDIYTTSDSGATWVDVPGANIANPSTTSEMGYNGYSLATVVPGGIGFFLTNKGRVYKTTDYGANWTVTATAPFTSIGSTGAKIYASSQNYIIAAKASSIAGAWDWKYTTDGGTTWQAYTPASPFYQTAMCYLPGSTNSFVATSGSASYGYGVAYSTDGGLTWTDFSDTLLKDTAGANIQCLGEGFYSANIGWVGIFDITGLTNPILKYHNTATIGFPTFQVEGNDFNIYPNPGNGLVQFAMNGANNKDANIKVFDITGNMIFERTLNVNGVSNISYDFSNFSKGIYIVNISSGNDNFNKKLIIN